MRPQGLAVLTLIAAVFMANAGVAEVPISDGAYPLLLERSTAPRSALWVYQDADSGLNHGFASGVFGGPGSPLALVDTDAACLDDAVAAIGCSSDFDALDTVRGTVFRITFNLTPGAPAEFAGVNFEEPENWGGNPRGVGWDLRGATDLVLDARSPDGISVQFGVAGKTTAFMAIPTLWTTLTIPLSGLAIPDLSDVHRLFTVVTNDANAPNGGTVLVDSVRFEPPPTSQADVLGLPLGTETFGVVPRTTLATACVPLPSDRILRNLATIYEAALVVLAFLDRGTPEDLEAARLIADTLAYAVGNDNSGLPLPVAPDGSTGLHSGYSSGDIRLRNDQGPGAGMAGEVRLAGFTGGTTVCGPGGFCLLLDGASGGNNAFAMLALLAAYKEFAEMDYLLAARSIGLWIVGLLTDTTGTGFGGYYVGYPDMGVPPPKPLIEAKSIENNADIFTAFRKLAAIERDLGDQVASDLWTARADIAGDFVLEMFDPVSGCFNAGTVPAGTPTNLDEGVDASGEQRGDDVVNVFPFLDAGTFTALAMARSPRYAGRLDWRRVVDCFDSFAKVASIPAGGPTEYAGFSLVEAPVCGADGVAWEFTGEAIVTMRLVDELYCETASEADAQFYVGELRRAQLGAPFTDQRGLPASTLEDGLALPPIDQCLQTPFQCIPERVGLAATAWAIFAERNFNPLHPPCVPDLVLENRMVDTEAVFEACDTITAGPAFVVEGTGKAILRTRDSIALRNGFTVEAGGVFIGKQDLSFEP